jgi:peptidoglycan/LPS O-acetylase OafA/YrhL
MAHIPALDGIRGLAILLVMLHHQTIMGIGETIPIDDLFSHWMEIGWSGVDLFFVLSGFLITGILLDAKDSPRYFKNFYARRTLRIFPLYYAVVFLALVVIPNLPDAILPAAKRDGFGRIDGDEIWYWLYLSNFSIANAAAWRHGILDISWSLAIEEQFYLMWPTLVFFTDRRRLMQICGGIIVGAFLVRVYMVMNDFHPIATYVLTPARLDPLAVGALIAAAARGEGGLAAIAPLARRVLLATGAALLVSILVMGELDGRHPWTLTAGFSLLALFFGGLLVGVLRASPGSRTTRIFESGFLTTLGTYSYALYLFHLPLRALIRDTVYGRHDFFLVLGSRIPAQLLFYIVASLMAFAMAWLSWQLLESRFLALKKHFQ